MWSQGQKINIMKFVIKKTTNGKHWYFTLVARNGEKLVRSEMHESKQACKKGIKAVRKALFARVQDLTI